MRTSFALLAATLSLGLSTLCLAQNSVLLGGGFFHPTDGTIRGIFGDQLKFDPSFGSMSVSTTWKVAPSVGFISARKDGNKFAVLPVSLVLERSFAEEGSAVAPFVKIGAGPNYVDYAFDYNGTHYAAKKIGWGGSVAAGVVFNSRFRLMATYNALAKVDGFNFSGVTLAAQYAVLQF